MFVVEKHTACEVRMSDLSSDVCSSDLPSLHLPSAIPARIMGGGRGSAGVVADARGRRNGAGSGQAGPTARDLPASAPPRVRVRRAPCLKAVDRIRSHRSEEHTSELQSLMRISYAVFCLKKKTQKLQY